ncbi:helix-turn-helix domain-containing protein [Brevundimonas sp.]
MSPQEFDVIVRVAGATLLLVGVPLIARGDRRLALAFLPLAICLTGFLAGNTPDPALRLSGVAGHLAYVLTGYAAVFLWWFCLAVFDRAFRPTGGVLAIGLAWIVIASADRGVVGPTPLEWGLSRLLVGLGFVMVLHLAWKLIRDRPGDLIDTRRQARIAVIVLLAGQLLADLIVDTVMGFDWQPQTFSLLQNTGFLLFTGWLIGIAQTGTVRSAPDASPLPLSIPRLSPEEVRLTERLRALIEEEQVHLDPTLTFDRFVSLIGGSDRAVRRLINQRLGHDHFRSFLNTHRLIEARRRLADPAHRQDKLIAIAMDSGFASLASFNRVFHDAEGQSPGAWRKATMSTSETRSAVF